MVANGRFYLLQARTRPFRHQKLTDQGAIDVETLNAPSLTDQANAALSALLSGLKWAIPAVLILFAIYWSIKTYNLTK